MSVIGREALKRILSASKRERFEFKHSQRIVFETDRTLKVFARLISLSLIMVGFAVCDVYDVSNGVLTVSQYSWWGMKKKKYSLPSITGLKITMRVSCAISGPTLRCLIIRDNKTGEIMFRSFRSAWHGYEKYNNRIETVMRDGGCYHERIFAWLVNCSMWALGMFFVTLMPTEWLDRSGRRL